MTTKMAYYYAGLISLIVEQQTVAGLTMALSSGKLKAPEAIPAIKGCCARKDCKEIGIGHFSPMYNCNKRPDACTDSTDQDATFACDCQEETEIVGSDTSAEPKLHCFHDIQEYPEQWLSLPEGQKYVDELGCCANDCKVVGSMVDDSTEMTCDQRPTSPNADKRTCASGYNPCACIKKVLKVNGIKEVEVYDCDSINMDKMPPGLKLTN